MKREKKFSWPIFAGAMFALFVLCCGGLSLPYFVCPLISERQAEELRQDTDRLIKRKESFDELSGRREIPRGAWSPAIRSLNPNRVELIDDELFIDIDSNILLGRGIVVIPEGLERPNTHGSLNYYPMRHRVFRYVSYLD